MDIEPISVDELKQIELDFELNPPEPLPSEIMDRYRVLVDRLLRDTRRRMLLKLWRVIFDKKEEP